MYVYDEHYKKEELAVVTAERIREKLASWRITDFAAVADHEADRNEELIRRGIPCALAKKVDVLGNRVQIKELLWQRKLVIDPRCQNLIRDLQAAVWHPKKEGELDDSQCTWGHFDGESTLRYLVRELSEAENSKPIQMPVSQAAGAARVNHTDWIDQ
jgi:phage terminase large subunit